MLWGLPYLFVFCDVEPSANGQVVSDHVVCFPVIGSRQCLYEASCS